MRHLLALAVVLAVVLAGCSGAAPSAADDVPDVDAGAPTQRTCPLPTSIADAGALSAIKAQMCNYPGSMGMQHWYRLSASLPGAPADVIQIELYDKIGAFAGGAVHTGTFPVDTSPLSCGVCVRGLADKAAADAKEYFANAGSVTVSAIGINGEPIAVSMSGITFVELDKNRAVVAGGCTTSAAGAQISGTVVQVGGTGGGGGGGGGGGNMCVQTIGD